MKSHDLLDNDVDLGEIASLTKNFSGAEIAGTIEGF
jgi:vesicle-fusing ATPase